MAKSKHDAWLPRETIPITFKGHKPRALMWKLEIYKEWFKYAKYTHSLGYKVPVEFGDLSKFSNKEVSKKEFEKEWKQWWHPSNFFAADLFLEPPFENRSIIKITCDNYKKHPNKLLIELDLNRTQNQIKADFRLLMKELNTAKKYIPVAKFQPSKPMKELRLKHAEHEHNEKKDLPVRLCNPRLVHRMMNDGIKQTEIAYKLGFFAAEYVHFIEEEEKEIDGVLTKKIITDEYVTVTDDEVYKWKLKTTGRGNTDNEVYGYPKDNVCEIRYKSAIRRVARNRKQCEDIFKSIVNGTFP